MQVTDNISVELRTDITSIGIGARLNVQDMDNGKTLYALGVYFLVFTVLIMVLTGDKE